MTPALAMLALPSDQLAEHDGSDPGKPLYFRVQGRIFCVADGAQLALQPWSAAVLRIDGQHNPMPDASRQFVGWWRRMQGVLATCPSQHRSLTSESTWWTRCRRRLGARRRSYTIMSLAAHCQLRMHRLIMAVEQFHCLSCKANLSRESKQPSPAAGDCGPHSQPWQARNPSRCCGPRLQPRPYYARSTCSTNWHLESEGYLHAWCHPPEWADGCHARALTMCMREAAPPLHRRTHQPLRRVH